MKTIKSQVLKSRNENSPMTSVIRNVLLRTKRLILPVVVGVGILAGPVLTHGGETVPFKSKYRGHLTFTPSGGFTIEETGIATHVGNFTLVGATDATGIFWFTMTASSGDKILGFTAEAAPDLSWVALVIYDGTGRFEGASGDFTGIVTMDWSTLDYTVVGTGSITTVGSNKN